MWFIEFHHLGYQHFWSRGRTGVENMSKSQNLATILKRPETSYGTLIQVLLAHHTTQNILIIYTKIIIFTIILIILKKIITIVTNILIINRNIPFIIKK